MENLAFAPPLLDLFGEQVIIQRRSFERRPRKKLPNQGQVQLGFHDILEMSDAELEALRAQDEITEDYVYWLREYLLKLTLRQLIHPQVSAATYADAMTWMMSDEIHPFSFRVCCESFEADHEDVRTGVEMILRKKAK